ncbi:MAG: CRTAC1 family protein [Gemmatimonadetes bacterium]|nr:CRTAC1 family protein [Gemmatimonadota bacterium]MYB70564.1 CRTAC1 family protein [Gemmatimonadota bacterium]
MSSYLQALLLLAYAAPVFSAGPLFTDVTQAAGIAFINQSGGADKQYIIETQSAGGGFWDYDRDGDRDLYVANDGHPNSLFRNDGGRFVNISLATGTAYSGNGRAQAGMGVTLADYDNDLQVDIVVTNFSQDHNTLYRNEGDSFFTDVTGRAGLASSSRPFMGWGTFFFDYDHDGWQDLFVANGHLMPAIERGGGGLRYRQRNLGDGRFRETANGPTLATERVSRGAANGDYDSDGDLDILVANLDDSPALLRNDVEDKGHWLLLTLRQGAIEAIGTHVHIQASGRHQMREVLTGSSFQAQSDTRLHFGLGTASEADIEITWPSGERQIFHAVSADHHYVIHRGVNRLISE